MKTLRALAALLSYPSTDLIEAADEIRQAIKAKGLTNLCVPREIRSVSEIPKLGTGKINHRALIELVQSGSQG